MTITLITPEQYERLLAIQQNHPVLTFQNEGYQYVNNDKFTQEDTEAFNEVNEMLKLHIKGFKIFNNFIFSKHKDTKELHLRIRFQYDWTADDDSNPVPFTGVGYLEVEELLKGFNGSSGGVA
jgi:hypothetical protein